MRPKIAFQRFFASIRQRTLAFSLGTVLVLGLVSYYSQWNAQWVLKGVWQVYERQKSLLQVWKTCEEISAAMESYLTYKGSESLLKFIRVTPQLEEELTSELHLPSGSVASQGIRRNLFGLGQEFLMEAQKAVNAKRGRDEEHYSTAYEKSQRIASFLKNELDQLSLEEYRSSLRQASAVYQQLGVLQLTNTLMLALLLALAVLLSFLFSWRLTEPLDLLSRAASEIARGNYEVELPRTTTEETAKLTAAFDRMRRSIVKSIDEIRTKAEVENENLRMKALLRNAEFQALQAQINPHFLFNTLNAASQLAMMEDAPETERILEKLAKLMRHNIRQLDKPVFLSDEIQSLENYTYIIRIRFGKRISFETPRDYAQLQYLIPPMTLQPLVENAVLHGLKDREKGGLVQISILDLGPEWVGIEVKDNGEGMPPEVVRKYLNDVEGRSMGSERGELTGHSTGIGLGNVIHRLQLFYGRKDIIEIESQRDQGTRILVRVPKVSEA